MIDRPSRECLSTIFRMLTAGEETVPTTFASRVPWDTVRWVAVCGYGVTFAVFCATLGVPLDRVGLTLWIVAGLSSVCVGSGWRGWGRMMLDWLPFQGVLLVYDYSYGAASYFTGSRIGDYPVESAHNRLGMPLHVTLPAHLDEWLFGGILPEPVGAAASQRCRD